VASEKTNLTQTDFNKYTPKDMARRSQVFFTYVITHNKTKIGDKNTQQCSSITLKTICKNLGTFDKKKWFFHPNRHLAWFCTHPFNYNTWELLPERLGRYEKCGHLDLQTKKAKSFLVLLNSYMRPTCTFRFMIHADRNPPPKLQNFNYCSNKHD